MRLLRVLHRFLLILDELVSYDAKRTRNDDGCSRQVLSTLKDCIAFCDEYDTDSVEGADCNLHLFAETFPQINLLDPSPFRLS